MIAHSRLLLLCGLFACEHTAETDTRNTQTSRSGPNGPPSPDRGRTPSVVGDADDDGVADSADECPDEGVWDDFDGDGCADDNRQMACDGDWLQGTQLVEDFEGSDLGEIDMTAIVPAISLRSGEGCGDTQSLALWEIPTDTTELTIRFEFSAEDSEGMEVAALIGGDPSVDVTEGVISVGLNGGSSSPELWINEPFTGLTYAAVHAGVLYPTITYRLEATFSDSGYTTATLSQLDDESQEFFSISQITTSHADLALEHGAAGVLVGRQSDGHLTCADNLTILANGTSFPFPDCELDTGDTGAPEGVDADDDGIAAAEDCDDTDDAVGGPTTYHLDYDRDGVGSADWTFETCLDLSGIGIFFESGDDCDDTDPAAGAPNSFFADADGDGHGDAEDVEESCADSLSGRVSLGDDCDDSDALILGPNDWFADTDGDGFGDPEALESACTAPNNFVADSTDCADGDVDVNPGATDTCGDGVDSNCDGVGDDEGDDEDGDLVSNLEENEDGADPCNPDDDADGRLTEGNGDADYDGIPDYQDPTDDTFVVINADAEWTNSTRATVYFDAPAGSNQICTANSTTAVCRFATFTTNTKAHTLASLNGTKTVVVRFRDSAHPTVVSTFSDSIGLDTSRPTDGSLGIVAAASEVTLTWTPATDATSGVASYTVVSANGASAPSSCTAGTVQAAAVTTTSLRLNGLTDGQQLSFRVCARDRAGNLSTGIVASETPGADQGAPSGTVLLAGGASHTGNRTVAVGLSATDAEGAVAQMCVSTSATCSAWTAFSTTASVTFPIGTATRTVYANFRDGNGNTSTSAASDTIVVDATRPTDGTLSASALPGTIELSWTSANDAHAGVASYTVVSRAGSAPTTCNAGTGIGRTTGISGLNSTLSGLSAATSYGIRVCAVDAVGNVSTGRTAVVSTPAG